MSVILCKQCNVHLDHSEWVKHPCAWQGATYSVPKSAVIPPKTSIQLLAAESAASLVRLERAGSKRPFKLQGLDILDANSEIVARFHDRHDAGFAMLAFDYFLDFVEYVKDRGNL